VGQDVILTKADQLEWNIIAGGFKYKFIGVGEKFQTGIGVAEPGGGETWHKHTSEVEETYYVLKGKGTIWWRVGGKERTIEFS
jgi:mannose-6-phosphate isomerase-like protein (cupin superfamily)